MSIIFRDIVEELPSLFTISIFPPKSATTSSIPLLYRIYLLHILYHASFYGTLAREENENNGMQRGGGYSTPADGTRLLGKSMAFDHNNEVQYLVLFLFMVVLLSI